MLSMRYETSRHPEPAKRGEGSRNAKTTAISRSFAVFAAQDDVNLLLLIRLLRVANDAELLEQLVSVDDHVAVRQLRNLPDFFLLQCVDELQAHIGVAGAAVQRRALSANAFRNGGF